MRLRWIKIIMFLLLAALPELMLAFDFRGADSSTPVKDFFKRIDFSYLPGDSLLKDDKPENITNEQVDELINTETSYNRNEANRNALTRLFKVMRIKKILRYEKSRRRFYSGIAGISARLNLYPLAMQCYYQSVYLLDSATDNDKLMSGNPDFLEDMRVIVDTSAIKLRDNLEGELGPVQVEQIIQSFDDNKPVFACALMLHIKQPIRGKRKAFAGLNNVGHMFITLIKYNMDGSVVTRSFGFYPDKDNILSATPLHPSSSSVIKDDAFHDWDEVVGKFISQRRLLKILRLLDKYGNKKYHLNANNCTDFGLYAAMISGIDLRDTKGKWPFGKGNNPASTGQSILEGKLINADTGNSDGLFLYNKNETALRNFRK